MLCKRHKIKTNLILFLKTIIISTGAAGEIYGHGLLHSFGITGSLLGYLMAAHLFVPVFYELNMTSINEVSFNVHLIISIDIYYTRCAFQFVKYKK